MSETTQQNRLLSISTPLEEDFLLLNRLTATEEISALFEYEVELLHEEDAPGFEATPVDVKKLLGQAVSIEINQRDGTVRTLGGMITRFSQGHRDVRFSYYYATVSPAVWLLTQISQSRIFQHLTVPDILKKVLAGFEVSYEVEEGKYKPRNYCVQYRETDFDFASRLLEEEGIYYYFDHTDGRDKMVIADTPQSHRLCLSKSEIPFALKVPDQEDFVTSIKKWQNAHQLQSGKVSFWDFNFQLPNKKLDAAQPTIFEVADNQNLELYDFPAGYARKVDGIDRGGGEQAAQLNNVFEDKSRKAEIVMQSIDSQYRVVSGNSDCSALTTGYRFKFFNHPTADQNGQYVVTSITHEAEQNPTYVTDDDIDRPYNNSFTCIAYGNGAPPFRPPLKTPKPIIQGSQTAMVVGPAGEEIFTDKYGRVKVQFHWDRDGEANFDSSCWMRVAQGWAGNRWGMMFIPRIGMEVIVQFMEGDPDQPVITGCVYNPQTMPPYTLPDEKTKMTIKSDSSKGGNGFNEFRFEDKKDSEQIFVHGEKDIDVRNKNDRREYVGSDHHFIVARDRREKIGGNLSLAVGGDQLEEISGSHHLKIKAEQRIVIETDQSIDITGDSDEICQGKKSISSDDMFFMRGQNVVIKALSNLTLIAGGSKIVLDASGIYINGTMVNINSAPGNAMSGSAATLKAHPPAKPDLADDAKPGTKIKLERTSAARKEKRHKEDKTKKSWIKIAMVDEAGKPVPGISYRIKTPSGRIASGSLNKKGEAEVKGIDPGNCEITFPDLDEGAVEEA